MAIFNNMTTELAAYPVTNVGERSTFKVRVTNTTHRRALVALAAVLAVSFGATSQAGAAGLACKPDVHVTNNKGKSIKVLNFRYTVNGTEHTEALDNKRLAVGETGDWLNVNLQEVADGIVIDSTRVQYKDDTSGVGSPVGDPYGPPRFSVSFPHTFTCGANHNYNHVIQ